MRIMGVDPGVNATGYCVIEDRKLLDFGTTRPKGLLFEKLLKIHQDITAFIGKWQPDVLAMEAIIYHKNPSTAITMGAARGVILLAGAQNQLEIVELSPTQVKKSITGTGRADKASVKYMIKNLFKLEANISEHASDAVAVAWCASLQLRL